MTVVEMIVLAVRFLLEVVTGLGLLSGVYFAQGNVVKILFLIVGLGIILLWSRYGAPKSVHALSGSNKLLLEMFVYSCGIVSFFILFGSKIGFVYATIVVIDLILMYRLKLQGH
ncbi:DUF2568 domain-containing protein [Lapidilactobacillus gannanensis]|uniref:DUF2568 domain-containing protein n=1 Tax=Lapidilactobacillus gannanensis TaxID=2486002 RepID=A0ABW4BNX1_9LACO|nr:DUF2568 domain-containing protein [Lapidilactobacillus gannanensis]